MLTDSVLPTRRGDLVAKEWTGAVEELYERWAARVAEYARRMNVDPGAADDVLQEAFARLLAIEPGRRPDEPIAWIFRVAHNLTMDRHRSRARVRPVAVRAEVAPEEAIERAEIWSFVEQLPERQRAAVFLRYRADLDFATVARILEISESGARASVFRGLATLRSRLGEDRRG
jgi:RNA polymerase sigma factor (sigma-70 family)